MASPELGKYPWNRKLHHLSKNSKAPGYFQFTSLVVRRCLGFTARLDSTCFFLIPRCGANVWDCGVSDLQGGKGKGVPTPVMESQLLRSQFQVSWGHFTQVGWIWLYSWAVLNDEQMSNKVGVEHQPDRGLASLKLTASLPLKIGRLPQKETRKYSNHPFSGAMLVWGRVCFIYQVILRDYFISHYKDLY